MSSFNQNMIDQCIDLAKETPFDSHDFRDTLDVLVSERGGVDDLRMVVNECREEIKQVLILEGHYPLLHYSAHDDDNGEIFELILELWIEAGLSIDHIYKQQTSLEIAIARNNDDAYRILIERGANVNISCKEGYYPLMRVFDSEINDKCLIFDVDGADLTIIDDDGFNLLHYAVTTEMDGVDEVLINLLNKGFSPNERRNNIDEDPLSLAIKYKCPGAVKILIEHGAYVRYSHLYECLTTKYDRNYNKYYNNLYNIYYRHHGNNDMAECILTILDNRNINLNVEQYFELLSNAPSIDIIKRLFATYHSNLDISPYICDDINDMFKQTLLHKVVYMSNDIELIRKILFEMGGIKCLNMRNIHGNTPLHIAAMYRNKEIISLLIDAGADKTIKNVYRNTPAQSAIYYKKKEIGTFIDEYNNGEDIKEPDLD